MPFSTPNASYTSDNAFPEHTHTQAKRNDDDMKQYRLYRENNGQIARGKEQKPSDNKSPRKLMFQENLRSIFALPSPSVPYVPGVLEFDFFSHNLRLFDRVVKLC